MAKTEFTIEEIRKYLMKQDSLGVIAYNLSAANIIKANEPELEKCKVCNDGFIVDGFCDNCGTEVGTEAETEE